MMKKKMNRVLLIASFIVVAMMFTASLQEIENADVPEVYTYLSNVLDRETGSKNIVTGIYLDYRLFDTMFEATILFTTVTGVLFMSKKDDTL